MASFQAPQVEDTAEALLTDEESGDVHANADARIGRRGPILAGALAAAAGVASMALLFMGSSSKAAMSAPSIVETTFQCSGTEHCYSASGGRMAYTQLSEVPDGSCPTPKGFCHNLKADKLEYHDCDGDGILDPYCTGGELLKFGYISSKNGCKNNWPNGLCQKQDDPNFKANKHVIPAYPNEVTIIHFNDVYQVAGVLEHGTRKGGMSRAAYVVEQARKRNPDRTFVVFAGDLLSPSVLSDLFEGEQMVDILNYLNLTAASLGNHEFDFGVDTLAKRVKQSKFPWLNINLMDENGKLLPGTTERLILDVPFAERWSDGKQQKSTRVCLFGSAYDVRETMFKDKKRISYKSAAEAGAKEAKSLREDHDCKIVLALTHQFSIEDCKFSAAVGEDVDLILGGHDHSTELKTVCGHAPYVKADSDLKTSWVMTLMLTDEGKVESVEGKLFALTDADPFSPGLHDKVVEWEMKGKKEMGKKMGCTNVSLDSVAAHVRQHEVNAADFFTDAVKAMHKTDIVLINGGTIRGNKEFPVGDLTKQTLTELHPFGNAVAKIYATGAEVKKYIDDMLACYNQICGNFVQVSGMRYSYDPAAPAGERVKTFTFSNGTAIEDDQTLTVAITDYMLANSDLKNNKLYNMVTMNDAVPLVQALFPAVQKAGADCIAPKIDGRIKQV